MIVPTSFYRGNPLDGTAASGDIKNVVVFNTGVTVPTWRRWRIEEITVTNMTQVVGYYSVAIFPAGIGNPAQPWPGELNSDTLPKSVAGGPGVIGPGHPLGPYIAFSQPVPPVTTRVMPVVAYAFGSEQLWVGAYPGGNELSGFGGIAMIISGREYRD